MEYQYIEAKNLNYVIYDVETLKGAFTIYFKSYKKEQECYFIIHKDRNDLQSLLKFLKKLKDQNYYFVGFNNVKFDSQILNFIYNYRDSLLSMSTEEVISNIYKKAQEIIRSEEIFFKHTFKQIDIFKQKHYDGKAKLGTSLK